MKKIGRKSQKEIESIVTEQNKMTVLICGQFTSKQELMRQFGIGDQSTFDRHFGELYKQSSDFLKSTAAKAFYKALHKGDSANVKHAAKTVLNLTEKREMQEVTLPDITVNIVQKGKDDS